MEPVHSEQDIVVHSDQRSAPPAGTTLQESPASTSGPQPDFLVTPERVSSEKTQSATPVSSVKTQPVSSEKTRQIPESSAKTPPPTPESDSDFEDEISKFVNSLRHFENFEDLDPSDRALVDAVLLIRDNIATQSPSSTYEPICGEPLSRHCPFNTTNGFRTCCEEHTHLDEVTASDLRFKSLFEHRLAYAGSCVHASCVYCSHVIDNFDTPFEKSISSQMLRGITSRIFCERTAALLHDDNGVDTFLESPGLINNISATARSIVTNRIPEAIANVSESINDSNIVPNISGVAATIAGIWDAVNRYFSSLVSFTSRHSSAITVAAVTLGLWAASRITSSAVIAMEQLTQACKFLGSMGFSVFSSVSGIASKLMTYFSERYMPNSNVQSDEKINKESTITSHMGTDKSKTPPRPTPDGVCAILAAVFLMALPDTRKAGASSIALAITRATALARGLKTCKDGLAWLAQCLPLEIQQYLVINAGHSIEIDIYDEYKDLLEEANALNMRYHLEGASVLNDVPFCERITAVYMILKERMPDALADACLGSATRSIVQGIISQTEAYVQEAQAAINDGGIRQPPVGVYIWGRPGIGKSSIINGLAAALYRNLHNNARAYGRNYSDAYWSKYHGQPFVYIDDYGTATGDVAGDLSREVMQLVSCVPYGLNMADVNEKGMPFTSEVLLLTSNKPIDSPHEGITCQDAFRRRFNSFKAVLRPEWKLDQKLNTAKFNKLSPEEQAMCPHLRFIRYEHVKKQGSEAMECIPSKRDNDLSLKDVAIIVYAARTLNREFRKTLVSNNTYFADYMKMVFEGLESKHAQMVDAKVPESAAAEYEQKVDACPSHGSPFVKSQMDRTSRKDRRGADSYARRQFRRNGDTSQYAAKSVNMYELLSKKDEPSKDYKDGWDNTNPAVLKICAQIEEKERNTFGEPETKLTYEQALSKPKLPPPSEKKVELKQKAYPAFVPLKRTPIATLSPKPRAPSVPQALSKLTPEIALATQDIVGEVYKNKDPELVKLNTDIAQQASQIYNLSLDAAKKVMLDHPYDPPPVVDPEITRYERIKTFISSCKAKFVAKYATSRIDLKLAGKILAGLATVVGTGVLISRLMSGSEDDDNLSDDDCDYEIDSQKKQYDKSKNRRKKNYHTRQQNLRGKQNRYGINSDDRFVTTSFSKGRIIRHHAQICAAVENEEHQVNEQENVKQRAMYTNIYKNMVSLKNNHGSLFGFIIEGTSLITNLHFFRRKNADSSAIVWLDEGEEFAVSLNGITYMFTFEMDRLVQLVEGQQVSQDIVAYRLTTKFPACPDISKYFATDAFVGAMKSTDDAYFMRANCDVEERVTPLTYLQHELQREDWSAFPGFPTDTYVSNYFSYDSKSNGDCGSLIIVPVDGPGKIISMHIAGRFENGSTSGMGLVLSRELMNTFVHKIHSGGHQIQRQNLALPCDISTDYNYFPALKGDFEEIGVIVGKSGGVASKTKLTPSSIRDEPMFDDVLYGPAALTSDTHSTLDIIALGVSKGGTPIRDFEQADVDAAVADMIDVMETHPTDCEARVLSLEETINGGGAYPFISPLPMNSSEGFPYVKSRPFGEKGKRWAFSEVTEEDPVRRITFDPIKEDFDSMDLQCRAGVRPPFIYTYVLKDECRAQEKIDSLSTRVICCSPVVKTLLMRKYFGAYNNHFQSSFPNTYSAVGMSVFSKDWDDMIKKLFRYSTKGFDGDYQKFERYLTAQLAEAILETVEAWYRKHGKPTVEETRARHTLMMTIIHTICKIGPYMFWKHFNNPSGNYLTAFINTQLGAILMRVAWRILARASGHPEMQDLSMCYRRLVGEKYYGDDNMMAVAEQVSSWFNALTIGAAFKEHGIVYTPANKGDTLSTVMKPILELSFLKMVSRRPDIPLVPGITYYGVPDEDSVLKSLLFVQKDLDQLEATEMNCDDALRRTFTKGKTYFNSFRDALADALQRKGSTHPLITFGGCYDLWLNGKLDCFAEGPGMIPAFIDDFMFAAPRVKGYQKPTSNKKCPIIFSQVDPKETLPKWAPEYLKVKELLGIAIQEAIAEEKKDKPDTPRPVYVPTKKAWSDRYIFSQMEASDSIVDDTVPANIQEDVQSSVVAPDEKSSVAPNKTIPNQSVRDIIKRFSPFLYGGTEITSKKTIEIGSFYVPVTDTTDADKVLPGTLAWWSAPYRVYKGSTRVKVLAEADVAVCYTATPFELKNNANIASELYAGQGSPGKSLSGVAPFAVTRQDIGLLEVQVPFISQYHLTILPKEWSVLDPNVVDNAELYSPGQISWESNDPQSPDTFGRVWVAGGDDMRFGYLYQVPSIHINALGFVPHNGTSEPFNIDEFVKCTNLFSAPPFPKVLFTQKVITSWIDRGAVYTDNIRPVGSQVEDFTLATKVLTNDELKSLGYNILPHQTRTYNEGVTDFKNYDFDKMLDAYADVLLSPANGISNPLADIKFLDGIPTGTVDTVNYKAGTYRVADEWSFGYESYEDPRFRELAGVAADNVILPLIPGGTEPEFNYFEGKDSQDNPVWQISLSTDYLLHPFVPAVAETKAPPPPKRKPRIVSQMLRNGDSDSKIGVSFADTTACVPSAGGRGQNLAAAMPDDDMSEVPIDFSMIVDRYQWTETLEWQDNIVRNSVLASYVLPWDLLTSITNQSSFKSFVYWRGKIRIKIQLQSNMFQQGCLIAYFVPLTDFDEVVRHIASSRASQTACPHVLLAAGASRNATLDIPFVHNLKRLDLGESAGADNALGTLVISVFNQLKTGPSATGKAKRAMISMFGSFPESNFQVLDPTATTTITSQGAVNTKNVTNNISGVTDSTIDFANRSTDNMEAKASADATIPAGMDKPNVGLNTTQVVRKKYPDLATVSNVEQNQCLSMYPNRYTMFNSSELGTMEDEMHFDYLRKRTKTFLDLVTWNDAMPEGTLLYTGLMTPCPSVPQAAVGDLVPVTLLEYTTLPFTLWRGGLKLTIQIVGSKIHTGRIVVCTHYGRSAASIPFESAMSQYAHIFDFSAEQNTFEVEFPWRSARQMLRVPSGTWPDMTNFSMGEFSIRVVNALQTMESVASDVEINLFWSAADDFTTDFLGANAIDLVPVVHDDAQPIT